MKALIAQSQGRPPVYKTNNSHFGTATDTVTEVVNIQRVGNRRQDDRLPFRSRLVHMCVKVMANQM